MSETAPDPAASADSGAPTAPTAPASAAHHRPVWDRGAPIDAAMTAPSAASAKALNGCQTRCSTTRWAA